MHMKLCPSNRRVHALSCIMGNQGKIVKKERGQITRFSAYFRSDFTFGDEIYTVDRETLF